jgi:hypothetical protein
MPLSKDAKGGGTEVDGGKSSDYCSHCYLGGKFTEPELAVNQMVEKVHAKMTKMHVPGFLARRFTKDIPTLKRWANR